ncbi:MAG: hypothetical protein WDN45_02760 [Caulobacteraceae bacterium]
MPVRFRLCGALALAAAIVGLSALAPARARAEIDPKAIAVVPFDKLDFKGQATGVQIATVFGDSTSPGSTASSSSGRPTPRAVRTAIPTSATSPCCRAPGGSTPGPSTTPTPWSRSSRGSFVIHHAGEVHYDATKDEPAMIYIVGMGPAPSIDREDPSTAPKK